MAVAVSPLMPATSVKIVPGVKKALFSARNRIITSAAVQKMTRSACFKASVPAV